MALAEWGITPEYVNESWTPEILWLMFYERRENIRRMQELERRALEEPREERRHQLSDLELFEKMKINPRAREESNGH